MLLHPETSTSKLQLLTSFGISNSTSYSEKLPLKSLRLLFYTFFLCLGHFFSSSYGVVSKRLISVQVFHIINYGFEGVFQIWKHRLYRFLEFVVVALFLGDDGDADGMKAHVFFGLGGRFPICRLVAAEDVPGGGDVVHIPEKDGSASGQLYGGDLVLRLDFHRRDPLVLIQLERVVCLRLLKLFKSPSSLLVARFSPGIELHGDQGCRRSIMGIVVDDIDTVTKQKTGRLASSSRLLNTKSCRLGRAYLTGH